MQSSFKQGLLLAIFTYSIWGLFPLYFKLLAGMPSDEVVVHRIVWSALFTFVLVLAFKKLPAVLEAIKKPAIVWRLLACAVLLAANWLVFIYATLHNEVMQLSLGYYINPLFNMLLGLIIFKEKTNTLGKVAITLAFLGLAVQLFQVSHFPYLALAAATVFSLYGAIRKGMNLDSSSSLFIETLLLLAPGLVYFLFFTGKVSLGQMAVSPYWALILFLVGPITSIPLMTFAAAVQRIPYSLMGFCQYITPTTMLILAIFLYQEPWGVLDLVTFGFIWVAIVLMLIGSMRKVKNT